MGSFVKKLTTIKKLKKFEKNVDKTEFYCYNINIEKRMKGDRTMTLIFVTYIIISLIFGFIGMVNAKTNKFNYSLTIALLMLMISPIVAHCCGLY